MFSSLTSCDRESAAILQYIVDKYDKEHKISIAPGTDEYYIQLQWLYFQASGQGPLFGQADWFTNYHPEKVPGAIERYTKEINRVFSVLESVLTKREWLVSNKATVSDFVFVTYVCFEHWGQRLCRFSANDVMQVDQRCS